MVQVETRIAKWNGHGTIVLHQQVMLKAGLRIQRPRLLPVEGAARYLGYSQGHGRAEGARRAAKTGAAWLSTAALFFSYEFG